MSYRPQRATGKGDANHMIPRDFLRDRCGGFTVASVKEFGGVVNAYEANYRGHRVAAFDTSKIGGLIPDWIVAVDNAFMLMVEIKTPEAIVTDGHGLTKGEKWLWDNGNCPMIIASTESEFIFALDKVIKLLETVIYPGTGYSTTISGE